MKKHLLAVAALAAFSSLASAQSVKMYGFLDVGVFTTNNGDSAGQSMTTMGQAGGNFFPSMYGFTGTEDLGGGMKASFNLQGSLNVTTGANADSTNIFGRYASVTLSGSAGSLEMGRQIDLLFLQSFVNGAMPTHANSLAVNGLLAYGGGDRALTVASAGAAGTTNSTNTNGTTNGNTNASRISNAITYSTPTIGGVTGKFMYAPGGVAGDDGAGTITSGLVTYNAGALGLSAGYETQNSQTGVTKSFEKSLVGAKYTVGALTLATQYHKYESKTKDIDTTAYELGVAYAVTPKLTVAINHESYDDNYENSKPKVTSLKAKYDLSKRTYLYGMAADFNGAAVTNFYQGYATTTGKPGQSATNFAVGVVHGF
jgi:predicted porin